jgi:transcriptional regulator with GAF, ATPase, and Fis domain
MSERDAALERRAEKLQASFAEIAHQSEVMRRLLEQAQRVAVRSVPVLLEGETGTGKDLLAEAIHKASPRRTGPFVAVNCGAIPEGLQESELFGHEKGAFTHATGPHRGYFEQAHRGTLFLDEVGELPLGAQVKLLRALQNRVVRRVGAEKDLPVDVRIVTATHRDLAARVRGGAFREDLYYRLAVLPLRVPALRDRHGDVKHLVEVLLHKQNEEFRRLGEEEKTLSVRARNVLYRHPWPGNVRELQAVLLRAAVLARGTAISDEDAREALGTSPLPAAPVGAKVAPAEEDYALRPGFSLPKELERVARGYLARAMKETGGNKAQATKLLGLASYQTLSNWLAKYKVKG